VAPSPGRHNRHGGLGLPNLQETIDTEHVNSTMITAYLADHIYNKKLNITPQTINIPRPEENEWKKILQTF